MTNQTAGIHHITAFVRNAQTTSRFLFRRIRSKVD